MLESLLLKWPILKDLMLLLSLNPMLLDHGSLIQMHQIIFLVTLLYSLKQNKGSLYLIPVDSKGLLGNCFTFHCDISFAASVVSQFLSLHVGVIRMQFPRNWFVIKGS